MNNADDYYAHLYDGWKDLYKTNVRYAIKEDFDDIEEDAGVNAKEVYERVGDKYVERK